MKMYLISDNIDTLTGMRLAGVDGIVVHEREELRCAIENAMEDKTYEQYEETRFERGIWQFCWMPFSRIVHIEQQG